MIIDIIIIILNLCLTFYSIDNMGFHARYLCLNMYPLNITIIYYILLMNQSDKCKLHYL